jgi:hypothetical protein
VLINWFNILAEGTAILCLANIVTMVTSISMSAVCTNGQIKAGKVFIKFIFNETQKIMCTKIIIALFVYVCLENSEINKLLHLDFRGALY